MSNQPYGQNELNPKLRRSKSGKLQCPVVGCTHWLLPPTRKPKFKGDLCPDHEIVVHSSGTYTYADYRRNLPVDAAYFEKHIRWHPFKYECHRFGSECSEDAVTWNVFRGLQQANALRDVVALCTGYRPAAEPRLFLWGLEILPNGVEPWNLLLQARDRFESDLPVSRPKTEMDMALCDPSGSYIILIEAKLTSINPVYRKDKAKLLDLTLGQMLQIYQWPGMRLLDVDEARRRDAIHYQLWRNLIFADYQSQLVSPATQPYVINLVREGSETDVCEPVLTLMPTQFRDCFNQISWEQVYEIARNVGANAVSDYMTNKTTRLKPAFKISRNFDTP